MKSSVCVCPFVSISWGSGQIYGPEILHKGEVEGYLGQINRLGSYIKSDGHEVKKNFAIAMSMGI